MLYGLWQWRSNQQAGGWPAGQRRHRKRCKEGRKRESSIDHELCETETFTQSQKKISHLILFFKKNYKKQDEDMSNQASGQPDVIDPTRAFPFLGRFLSLTSSALSTTWKQSGSKISSPAGAELPQLATEKQATRQGGRPRPAWASLSCPLVP